MNELKMVEQRVVLDKNFVIYGGFENPLFLAKDIAEWIEYDSSSVNKLLETIDDNEKLIGTLFRSGQNREYWFLTEDGVYEVLMQSRKPIAKEFKKQVKEILKSIRKNGGYIKDQESLTDSELMAKAILVAQKTIENKNSIIKYQQEKLEEQEPEVMLARAITGSSGSIPVGDMAKILNQNGIKIGRNRFFEYLREQKYLMKDGRNYNKPTQRSMDLGIMEYEETVIKTPLREKIEITPLITGEGQKYFVNKFLKEGMKENKKMGIFEQINLAFERL